MAEHPWKFEHLFLYFHIRKAGNVQSQSVIIVIEKLKIYRRPEFPLFEVIPFSIWLV